MRRILCYTISIKCLFAVFPLWGQAPAIAPDALLHINKPFYVTGEVIWYQLYLPSALNGQGFTVQATVLGEDGTVIDESFISNEGKPFCHGHFAIPYGLSSGVYRLWFTAMAEDGNVQTLACGDIPVYSDLQPLPGNTPLQLAAEPAPPPGGTLEVQLVLEPAGTLRPRQPARLRISVLGPSRETVRAWGSVAVRDEKLCGSMVLDGKTQFAGPPVPAAREYRSGINWHGAVVDENGHPFHTPLLGVVGVDSGQLLFTRSDQEGKFLLTLPDYAGKQRWQFVDHANRNLTARFSRPAPPPSARRLIFTQGIMDYLTYSRQRKKIYQLYATQETVLSNAAPASSPRLPGWVPTISYFMPNYERFPDMAAFFREVVPAVRFLSRRDGYAVKVYNPGSQDYFSNPPLFLVDGKATRDASYVAGLNPADVEQVDLLTTPSTLRSYYPAIGAGGVIRIRTRLPGLRLPDAEEEDIFSLPGLQEAVGFDGQGADVLLPALRPAVFWLPALRIPEEEGAAFTFLHSDDLGTFCIEVVVQSEDGRRGSGRYCYAVER